MLSDDRKRVILLHPVRPNRALARHIKMDEYIKKKSGWIPKDSAADRNLEIEAFENENGVLEMRAVPETWNTPPPVAYGGAGDRIWNGVPFPVNAGNDVVMGGRTILTVRGFSSPMKGKIARFYTRMRLIFDSPKRDGREIFAEIKNSLKELENGDAKVKTVSALIKQLAKTKQVAAARAVKASVYFVNVENKLIEAGYKKYLAEETLVRLITQCKRGLCISELEYFPLRIPIEVIEKIEEAENTRAFDNYYIFYYDPTIANVNNKVQKSIVFGVIADSDKLYYITNWECEYCLVGMALLSPDAPLTPLFSGNSIAFMFDADVMGGISVVSNPVSISLPTPTTISSVSENSIS